MALLCAVNVGGTVRFVMRDLQAICEAVGGRGLRTNEASGNAVFESDAPEEVIRAALLSRLEARMGRPVRLVPRSAEALRQVVPETPFSNADLSRALVIFLDAAPLADALDAVAGRGAEEAGRARASSTSTTWTARAARVCASQRPRTGQPATLTRSRRSWH